MYPRQGYTPGDEIPLSMFLLRTHLFFFHVHHDRTRQLRQGVLYIDEIVSKIRITGGIVVEVFPLSTDIAGGDRIL